MLFVYGVSKTVTYEPILTYSIYNIHKFPVLPSVRGLYLVLLRLGQDQPNAQQRANALLGVNPASIQAIKVLKKGVDVRTRCTHSKLLEQSSVHWERARDVRH